eukprot:588411_1
MQLFHRLEQIMCFFSVLKSQSVAFFSFTHSSAAMTVYKLAYSTTNLIWLLVTPFLWHSWKCWRLMVPVSITIIAIDFIVSDNPWKNIQIMKLNGLTTRYIAAITVINLALYNASMCYVYTVLLVDQTYEYRFDLSLIITIVIVLAIGDCLFYVAHKLLHCTVYGAQIHLMHHCCVYTSLSTNIWFHPLDFLIEFYGPYTVSWLWYCFSKDTFAFLVVSGIMVAWYAATHDEMFSFLPHHKHHRYVNCDYPIYVTYNVFNPNDKMKSLLKLNEAS